MVDYIMGEHPYLCYHEFVMDKKNCTLSTVKFRDNHYETMAIDDKGNELFMATAPTYIEALAAHKVAVDRFNLVLEAREIGGAAITGSTEYLVDRFADTTSKAYQNLSSEGRIYVLDTAEALDEYNEYWDKTEGKSKDYNKLMSDAIIAAERRFILDDESVPDPPRINIADEGEKYILTDEHGQTQETFSLARAKEFLDESPFHNYETVESIHSVPAFSQFRELKAQIEAVYAYELKHPTEDYLTITLDDGDIVMDYNNGATSEKIREKYKEITAAREKTLKNEGVERNE